MSEKHIADVSKMQINLPPVSGKDKIFGHISRWAAIEEILDVYFNAKEWRSKAIDREIQIRAESCMDTCFEIKLRIEQLPSIHSEIIRCKDCKHKPTGTDRHSYEFPDDRCPCQCEDYWYSWNPADDWFCANGERKSDE